MATLRDDLIEAIQKAIDRGNYDEARNLLKVALKEPTAEVYYLASLVALNEQQRQSFIDKANKMGLPIETQQENSKINNKNVDNTIAPLEIKSKEKRPKSLWFIRVFFSLGGVITLWILLFIFVELFIDNEADMWPYGIVWAGIWLAIYIILRLVKKI